MYASSLARRLRSTRLSFSRVSCRKARFGAAGIESTSSVHNSRSISLRSKSSQRVGTGIRRVAKTDQISNCRIKMRSVRRYKILSGYTDIRSRKTGKRLGTASVFPDFAEKATQPTINNLASYCAPTNRTLQLNGEPASAWQPAGCSSLSVLCYDWSEPMSIIELCQVPDWARLRAGLGISIYRHDSEASMFRFLIFFI